MTILRLRTEVADERGRLGRLATAIAACRGNILGLDVHFLDGARVADEFVIDFGEGGSPGALTTALRRAGGVTVEAHCLDERELVDPVARAIDLGAQLVAGGSIEQSVEHAVARLVRADRARLVDAETAAASPCLRTLCRDAGAAPLVRREHVLSAPGSTADAPWTLVVPDDAGPRRRWLVTERHRPPFSSSEIARVGALLRLSRAVAGDVERLENIALERIGPHRPVARRRGSFRRAAGTLHTRLAAP